jgi:DNA invertase Pin-like site-specific DNA recombinase
LPHESRTLRAPTTPNSDQKTAPLIDQSHRFFKGLRYAKDTCKSKARLRPCRMTIFGYARVSTDGQTLDAQVSALKAAGAVRVFRETASGAKTDRRELARALKSLGEGDTLLVTRLDRLARSTRDLLNMLDMIAKAGAGFRSLADAWADTTTAHGRLMLTVLGGLAEFERELIRARTGEGRKRAKERGVHMGRPAKLTTHQKRDALKALADGTATQADLARRFNVSQATISRLST